MRNLPVVCEALLERLPEAHRAAAQAALDSYAGGNAAETPEEKLREFAQYMLTEVQKYCEEEAL